MTPHSPIVTVDIGSAFVSLCRYDGATLHVERQAIGLPDEEWPRWMGLVAPAGAYQVVCRLGGEAEANRREIETAAIGLGAKSIRFVSDEPACDPAMAIVRQLGNRLGERNVCFLEVGATRWHCGVVDPSGRVVGRADGRIELGTAPLGTMAAALGEQIRSAAAEAALLIAYGGAGPSHAEAIAAACGLTRVVIPPHAAALAAIGMLIADIVLDYRQAIESGPIDVAVLRRTFARLMDEANDTVTREGYDVDNTICTRFAEMGYAGDSRRVVVSCEFIGDAAGLAKAFRREIAKTPGRIGSDAPIEVRGACIRVIIDTPKIELPLGPIRAVEVS